MLTECRSAISTPLETLRRTCCGGITIVSASVQSIGHEDIGKGALNTQKLLRQFVQTVNMIG